MNRSPHHPDPRPRHTRVEVEDLHLALMSWYEALSHPDQVFVVSVLGTQAHIEVEPIENPSEQRWKFLNFKIQLTSAELGRRIHHVYVFAYSPQARHFAEAARSQIESMGWTIVHADVTGSRQVNAPLTQHHNRDQAEDIDPIACTVREQRRLALQHARHILRAEPRSKLPRSVQDACLDALRDRMLAFACLADLDEDSVRFWRNLSITATGPLDALAGSVLAGIHQQRGEPTRARQALDRACRISQPVMGWSDRWPQALMSPSDPPADPCLTNLSMIMTMVDVMVAENLGPAEATHLADRCAQVLDALLPEREMSPDD
ncbi:DUF4192 domain-containing protein [Kineosporia babensis]|uniref:DUF4192 domain-containing protein n=1 Tax=Kineosporia babensis TaxID=499548 RepID=A0A9X1SZ03_9ACTN|nr:DUF4192 domain-containing protein [Kineosporia babensis]MCD5316885.1 DUF4192 domain-containing protein [Kineosporia babensis]